MNTRDLTAPPPGDDLRLVDAERNVRTHVHAAIAGIVFTFLAPVIGWGLWLADRRAPPGPWKRRLLALAILDTVLVLGLGVAGALGLQLEQSRHEPPRIGVVLDARDPPGGVVVARVVPASPASAASMAPGDQIVAVDGTPIEHNRELVAAIASSREGAERRLTVVRAGEELALTVRPTADAPKPDRSRIPLFEPSETEAGSGADRGRRFVAGAAGLELALLAGLSVAARRRRAPAWPGLAVLGGLVALSLTSTVVLLAFAATTGISLGGTLVALLSGSLALLSIGLLAMSGVAPAPPVRHPMRTLRAIALGVLYGLGGSARLAIALALLVAAFGVPLHTASETFGLDASWGPLGIGLFVFTAVIVAPVAEEIVFRGVLLPWLARWMTPAAALGLSTLVFALGHLYYGVGALLIGYYGLVFGWARLRTGRLWAPIALHALLNGATALALLLGAD